MIDLTTAAAIPFWLFDVFVPLVMLCIAILIWLLLPRRNALRDADIERQIATLRRHADHSVTHRPRLRGNGCSQPSPTHIKAVPHAPQATTPKLCGGGQCRHRADCHDHHCPGAVGARLDALRRTLDARHAQH